MSGLEVGLISVLAMLALIYLGMYVPVVLALIPSSASGRSRATSTLPSACCGLPLRAR